MFDHIVFFKLSSPVVDIVFPGNHLLSPSGVGSLYLGIFLWFLSPVFSHWAFVAMIFGRSNYLLVLTRFLPSLEL